MLDLTNQTFGLLTAKEIVGKERKGYLWRCECECGCMATEYITNLRKEDITNQTFGRLKATRPTEKRTLSGSIIWELECECGNMVHKSVNELKTGRILSCG